MRHIVEWTGLSEKQIWPLVIAGVLVGKPIKPGGRNFYHKEHVRAVFFTTSTTNQQN